MVPLESCTQIDTTAPLRIDQPPQLRRCAALQAAITDGTFTDVTPCAMFMDLDRMRACAHHLQHEAGYPQGALHTVAVKALPVGRVLDVFRQEGLGAEVASLGELAQALHVGFAPDRIVFDSPAKTGSELAFALQRGVRMNLDNFQELQRVEALLQQHPEWAGPREELGGRLQCIGLRINPQIGAGSIAALSTGGAISKFGFPLLEVRQQLVEAFVRNPWLNMLHLHVGSQGMPVARIVQGAEAVWGLLLEINAACAAAEPAVSERDGGGSAPGPTLNAAQAAAAAAAGSDTGGHGSGASTSASSRGAAADGRVRVLDIGGGLGVDFASDAVPTTSLFQQQAALLRERIPALFGGRGAGVGNGPTGLSGGCGVQLVTENGRSLLAKAGFAASRVEYTKTSGGRAMAVVHIGADLFTRTCYLPEVWPLRLFVCDHQGRLKRDADTDSVVEVKSTPGGAAAGVHAAPQAHSAAYNGSSSSGWAPSEGLVEQDICGPLCFQGDRLATAALLPRIYPGDFVMAVDTGAYTLAMYSHYNSRQSPPVYGYEDAPAEALEASSSCSPLRLRLLRAGDTLEQVLQYWNQT